MNSDYYNTLPICLHCSPTQGDPISMKFLDQRIGACRDIPSKIKVTSCPSYHQERSTTFSEPIRILARAHSLLGWVTLAHRPSDSKSC